jgi:hypothetical protein
MHFLVLWDYRTSTNISMDFTPFHLIHGEEVTLSIKCQIPSLHLSIVLLPVIIPLEQELLALENVNEDHHIALKTIEVAKKFYEAQYDCKLHPHVSYEGDLVLEYDQAHNILGRGKFEPLWLVPYIVKQCLGKGAYILSRPEGELLPNPCDALYLNIFYP